jgi:hypothetical protein
VDGGIERRVSRAVEDLKPVTDSKESDTRIADAKDRMIDFLRGQIGDYARRRSQLRAELDNPRRVLAEETLTGDMAIIDERINHRIEQIVALGGSLGESRDYDVYSNLGTTWVGNAETWLNKDWEKNRRAKVKEQKGRLYNAIDETIRRLESNNLSLRTSLAGRPSPAVVTRVRADIARNDVLIATLRGGRNALQAPARDSLRAVNAREASAMESKIRQADADARNDHNRLVTLYNDLNRERAALQSGTASLEAAKKKAGL